MTNPAWQSEILSSVATLLTTLVGGGLVILGGWVADRRKERLEREKSADIERSVLHGAFVITNYINRRLNEWSDDGRLYHLLRLQTAQSYIQKIISLSPSDSERIMVSLFDVGLQLDSLIHTIGDMPKGVSIEELEAYSVVVSSCVGELAGSLEILEVLVTRELPFMSEEELAKFPGYSETIQDTVDVEGTRPATP